MTFTVGDDDEANTVGFAVTVSGGELTETLKLYCITNKTLPFLLQYIYILNVLIYTHIGYCVRTVLLDICIEFEISYMM